MLSIVALLLCIVGQFGDLAESWAKRRFGVKVDPVRHIVALLSSVCEQNGNFIISQLPVAVGYSKP